MYSFGQIDGDTLGPKLELYMHAILGRAADHQYQNYAELVHDVWNKGTVVQQQIS